VAYRPPEPDALDISLVENLERNHTRWLLRSCCLLDAGSLATHRESSIASLVGVNEAAGAFISFEQIDRNKVLTAVRW
jgi:hypothetical protein